MSEQRIGLGVDLHRFATEALAAERPLVLGGHVFPGETPLVGHSDADVVAHAVGDARPRGRRPRRPRAPLPRHRRPLAGRGQPGDPPSVRRARSGRRVAAREQRLHRRLRTPEAGSGARGDDGAPERRRWRSGARQGDPARGSRESRACRRDRVPGRRPPRTLSPSRPERGAAQLGVGARPRRVNSEVSRSRAAKPCASCWRPTAVR